MSGGTGCLGNACTRGGEGDERGFETGRGKVGGGRGPCHQQGLGRGGREGRGGGLGPSLACAETLPVFSAYAAGTLCSNPVTHVSCSCIAVAIASSNNVLTF